MTLLSPLAPCLQGGRNPLVLADQLADLRGLFGVGRIQEGGGEGGEVTVRD